MTTKRMDPELGWVYPVVITFGDQPPQEIGVVQADRGAEQAVIDLVATLHDAADIMLIGGEEAIAQARTRHRWASLQDAGPVLHQGPASVYALSRGIHEGHVNDCAICNPDRLAAHHSDYAAPGGARLVEHLAGGVTCCAHHVPLTQSCQACGR